MIETEKDNFSATGQVVKKNILLPDIDWVEIPAGEFIYGEDDSQQTLDLDRFYISRYLITNSQFQTFIDAGAYQDEHWWQDLIKPEPEKSRWAQPNRPRERVGWYGAVAFTRWLSKQLGYAISLPSEQQWEKAARGSDGRTYPWGNKFEMGDANVNDRTAGEHNLQETTAVGLYLHRTSPYELMDMAGNLWEWCLNKWDRPDDMEVDSSGDIRVVRGGSWHHSPGRARCANRNWDNPVLRLNYVGFRVVCLSPYTDP